MAASGTARRRIRSRISISAMCCSWPTGRRRPFPACAAPCRQLEPGSATFRTGLGLALAEAGDLDPGLAQIRRGDQLSIRPTRPRAGPNTGIFWPQAIGSRAGRNIETRRHGRGPVFLPRPGCAVPQWADEDLAGNYAFCCTPSRVWAIPCSSFATCPWSKRSRPGADHPACGPAGPEGVLAADSEADLVTGLRRADTGRSISTAR